jgi:DNA-directed RNA polymerase subunit K
MNMKYTKYETARIIGARALQLSLGAPFAIEIPEDELKRINYDVLEIAKMEFAKDAIPISVKREISQYIEEKDDGKPALPIEELSTEVEKIASIDEPAAGDEPEE